MKISILDDYHDTLRTLDCFASCRGTTSRSGTITSRKSTRSPSDCARPMRSCSFASAPRSALHSSVDCRSSGSSAGAASTRTSMSTPERNSGWSSRRACTRGRRRTPLRSSPGRSCSPHRVSFRSRSPPSRRGRGRSASATRSAGRRSALRLRQNRQRRRRVRAGVRDERMGVGAQQLARARTKRRLRRGAQQGGVLLAVRRDLAPHAPGRRDPRHRHFRATSTA